MESSESEKMSIEMRSLRNDEIDRDLLAQLYNNAYRVGMDTARQWTADADMPSSVACIHPDGRIGSCVRIVPYEIYAGGRRLRMGGIGGVATWCDLQGQGYAGRCMAESVRKMHADGYDVAALYPFSYRYYRKFGWEHCCDQIVYSGFDQSKLVRYDEFRLVRAVLDIDRDAQALTDVYNEYAAKYNGMAVRSVETMKKMIAGNHDPKAKPSGQTYIIEEAGKATGYFSCNHIADGWPSVCEVGQFACNTLAAWRAMTGFMASMPTNVSKLMIYAPAMPSLASHYLEPRATKEARSHFMGRVLDMKNAVEKRGYRAEVAGTVCLSITDEHAPWNTGVWELSFGGGEAKCRQLDDDAAVDAALSIQTFSQIWFGYINPDALVRQGLWSDLPAAAALTLSTAFCDRTPYLIDFF